MEILTKAVSLVLLLGLLVSPVFILKQLNKTEIKYKFIVYLISCTIITAFLILALAWWAHTSDKLLLSHYGYNLDGTAETESYASVLPENRERVKKLLVSISGIGWPLKAIFIFGFYSPYLLLIYLVYYFFKTRQR